MTDTPRASGQRMEWSELPVPIRQAIEQEFGPVVAAQTMTGGFSPGLAARLTLASGETIFAKAVSSAQNELAPRFHRREIRVASHLPEDAPVSHIRWSHEVTIDDAAWVVLVFDNIAGHPPANPWDPAEVTLVVEALNQISRQLTPSPIAPDVIGDVRGGTPKMFHAWRMLQADGLTHADPWVARNLDRLIALNDQADKVTPGTTLLHMDLRGDNMLITPNGVVVVDWPHASIGPAWLDGVGLAPSMTMEGGPRPEELVQLLDAMRTADPEELTIGIVDVAGFFTYHGLLPAIPNLPGLRDFQEAQGAVARRWVAQRTGWE